MAQCVLEGELGEPTGSDRKRCEGVAHRVRRAAHARDARPLPEARVEVADSDSRKAAMLF